MSLAIKRHRLEGGGVSRYENIKDFGFDKRTADERREIAKRAGEASGKARRRKADFRKTLNLLLTTKIDSPMTPEMEALGLDSTLESAVNMQMIKRALAGDTKAYELIARYSGQSDRTEADHKEQRIRTDRAKRARDLEIGDGDGQNENIQSFLKAMNPSQTDMDKLFDGGDEENAEEAEEAGEF